MTAPYTDADVELVASTFVAEAKKNPVITTAPAWSGQTRMLIGPTEHDIARAVLNALAAAGRLIPDGTHTVEQFNTRLYRDGVLMEEPDTAETREHAQQRVDWHARKRAEDPTWRGEAVLVRCFQHTTPWEPVEIDGEPSSPPEDPEQPCAGCECPRKYHDGKGGRCAGDFLCCPCPVFTTEEKP